VLVARRATMFAFSSLSIRSFTFSNIAADYVSAYSNLSSNSFTCDW